MKLIITERQLKKLVSEVSNLETFEPDDTPASEMGVEEPTSGTSGSQDPGQSNGYPEVGVWESGATRGPGNPVGPVKKWTDTDGTQPVRGKANKLK